MSAKSTLTAEAKKALRDPRSLSKEDWDTSCRVVENPAIWLTSTGNAIAGSLGRLFSGDSRRPFRDGVVYAKYNHYVNDTKEYWKAAQYRKECGFGDEVFGELTPEVAYYLDFINGTGEFGPQTTTVTSSPVELARIAELEAQIAQLKGSTPKPAPVPAPVKSVKDVLLDAYKRGEISQEQLKAAAV